MVNANAVKNHPIMFDMCMRSECCHNYATTINAHLLQRWGRRGLRVGSWFEAATSNLVLPGFHGYWSHIMFVEFALCIGDHVAEVHKLVYENICVYHPCLGAGESDTVHLFVHSYFGEDL